MGRQVRQRSLFLPLVLIALGIVFLLNNLGLLAWDVWEQLSRLWPILLIALGLDLMIGRGSLRWAVVVVVIVAVLLGVGLILAKLGVPTEWVTTEEEVSQSLEDASRAEVELVCKTCKLQLGASSDPEVLIQGTVTLGGNENLSRSFWISGDTAHFSLGSKRLSRLPVFGRASDKLWFLRLNPDIPLRLKVEIGEGPAVLNLERLDLEKLNLDIGTGEVVLTLPIHGRLRARIVCGVGDVIVKVPEGVAVRARVETGVGEIHLPGDYLHQDGIYISPGYEEAEDRVDLEVRSGVGSITVEQRKSA